MAARSTGVLSGMKSLPVKVHLSSRAPVELNRPIVYRLSRCRSDISMNVVESNGLIETCVALKDSVTDLTIAVSILTGELTTLRERVAMLEMRLCHEPCGTDPDGPVAQHVDAVVVTTAEIHEQSTNYTVTDPDGPATQQADAVIVTIAETQEQATNNTETAPTSVYSSQLSYADVTSHTTTNDVLGEDDFCLSGQQRRRTRRGFGIQASTRSEIKGAASVKLRISAATKVEKQRLYHVYVGKLKENTSKKAVLDHLHDIGVSHVSDVIQLHRKTGGQASFCVSVDNSDNEDAMYNPDKWPAGALIRPYKLRTQTTRNQQTTREHRPTRHRTHQEPRARSYRLQAAARSSDRPTEYTRARDSYDSGKTHYSDDTDNTRARNRPDVERRRVSYRPYSSYNSY